MAILVNVSSSYACSHFTSCIGNLGESREHVVTRVLSTTNEEDKSQNENPIREVIHGHQQEFQLKPDEDDESERKEDGIDAQDQDAKWIESSQNSNDDSHVKVCIIYLI